MALSLSHVASEPFYTQQKGHDGHAGLREPLFWRPAQSPPLGGFFFFFFFGRLAAESAARITSCLEAPSCFGIVDGTSSMLKS